MSWKTAISISSDELWIKHRHFEFAQTILEPSLGKANKADRGHGWILTFYPRKAQVGAVLERSNEWFW